MLNTLWHLRLGTEGAFTQSVLRGVIRRRLGYLINKKCFFIKKMTILRGLFCPSVNATLKMKLKEKDEAARREVFWVFLSKRMLSSFAAESAKENLGSKNLKINILFGNGKSQTSFVVH